MSEPAVPVQVGSFNIGGLANSVAVSGNYAYLADGSGGLQVIDVSNPAAPVRVGHHGLDGSAFDVAVSGSYAYVADHPGLKVMDVSSPAAPVQAGVHNAAGSKGVAVSGKYAYLGTRDLPVCGGLIPGEGVVVIDVSNPSVPARAGNYDMRAISHGVTVSGQYVYSARGNLKVIDVTNPAAPVLAGTSDVPASSVTISGKHAYVAGGTTGLHVVDVSNPAVADGIAGLAIFWVSPEVPRIQAERARGQVILSWPVSESGFLLESANTLAPGTPWLEVDGAKATGDRFTITVNVSAMRAFYRLQER